MKRKQIILGAVFSVFLVVSTPVLANIFYGEKKILSNNVLKEVKVDQKELFIQIILDIANNKEIQRVILNSEISRGGFFNLGMRFSVITPQVLTKNHLKQMYFIGVMLSKTINKSRIHSMFERYQLNNQGVQKEITTVIENDATINRELTKLSNSKCDCENNIGVTAWPFPVICTILNTLLFVDAFLFLRFHIGIYLSAVIEILMKFFNCSYCLS